MRSTTVRSSRGLRVLGLWLVLLGVCVFAWGLRYKLSLYDSPHSLGRHMPAAKLLTSRERTSLPVMDLREAASLGAPLPGCTMLLALIARLDTPIRLRDSRSWIDAFAAPSPPQAAFSSPCNKRPPPSLL